MTEEYVDNKQKATIKLTIVSVIIAALLNFSATIYMSDKDDTKEEAKQLRLLVDSKASKEFVTEKINSHEKIEGQMFKNLETIIVSSIAKQEAIVQGQSKLVESIDKRLERMENNQ